MRKLFAAGVAVLGVAAGMTALTPAASAASASSADKITTDRATVREYPGRLVIANAVNGDKADVVAYCGDWVKIKVSPKHAMSTTVGWVMRNNLAKAKKSGGLDGVKQACGTDADRWRDWVGAINAPFHSVRKVDNSWRRIVFGTGVNLVPVVDCTPSLNYTRNDNGPDVVDPAQRMPGLDVARATYRYVTTDGSVALISVPKVGSSYGIWSFVPSACVQPKAGRAHVYYDEPVAQLKSLSGIGVGKGYSDASIRSRGCSAAAPSPKHKNFGYWPDVQPENRPHCPV